ncbi:MAG: hypothetical protein HYT87_06095 [Nitrospirae bacterium]|nr:hypothetical protein [Nitrospirota bacterium]
MLRLGVTSLSVLLLFSCDQSKPKQSYPTPIEHVIFISKENRTFDTYFGAYSSPSGDHVEGTTKGKLGSTVIDLPRGQDVGPYVMHEHSNALLSWNGGAMDGFYLTPRLYGPPTQEEKLESYVQYLRDDIPNYWALADRFALADHYFTSVMTSTFPNRLHSVAAQAAGMYQLPISKPWSCQIKYAAAPVFKEDCSTDMVVPCFDIPTIFDLVEAKGLTWKMYISPRDGGGNFNALYSIRRYYEKVQSDPAYADKFFPPVSQLAEDARRDRLPNVAFVIYPMELSEHAPEGPVCCGEEATTRDIWALMESPAWKRSLIILTWNDYGGYHDHVPPPEPHACPSGEGHYEPGFRVPAIFVSPYVRRGSVVSTVLQHGSVLRGIEDIFSLGMTLHDLDPRANDHTMNSIAEVLNFASPDFTVPPRTARSCPNACLAD